MSLFSLSVWAGIIILGLPGMGCDAQTSDPANGPEKFSPSPPREKKNNNRTTLKENDPQKDQSQAPRAKEGQGAKALAPAKTDDPAQASPKAGETKKVPAGRNVWLEIQGEKRRVIVKASVCLREGVLEHLMCRQRTKEHEAILAADVDAQDIHKALIIARSTPGSPVKYQEKGKELVVIPPTGTRIKITLTYMEKGKAITVPAQEWIRDIKTKKNLAHDWVFAGSILLTNPFDNKQPPLYGANAGDVITVSNFETAMLDLPIASSKDNADLAFEAHSDRIPPLDTPVTVILEPIPEAKKK